MRIPILMPQLGESIAEATIIRILVEAGRSVEASSDLFEVETNKATMSVTAPCAGKITQIVAVPQTSYAVGSTLAAFEISEEDAQNLGFADTPQPSIAQQHNLVFVKPGRCLRRDKVGHRLGDQLLGQSGGHGQ